jgi:hypothetical protein
MKLLPANPTKKKPVMIVRAAIKSHTTADEQKFLNKIGTYGENIYFSKEEYIVKYMQAAERRSNWADINKGEVIAHCHDLIVEELEKEKS